MIEHKQTASVTPIDGINRSGGQWRPTKRRRGAWALLKDVNAANVVAAMTAVLFYMFGAIPLLLGTTARLNLAPEVQAGWFFVAFTTASVSGIVLSILFRQPLAVGWTIPGLVLIAEAGRGFTFPELMGACLAAGVVIVVLGILGIGERMMKWVPLPVVLGMFAGTTLGFVTAIFDQFDKQPIVTGVSLLGFVVCWVLRRSWLPPVGGAVVPGLAAAGLLGQLHPEGVQWGAPVLMPVVPSLSPGAMITLTLPLVVMVIGMGNVQGIGFLLGEGYRPPIRLLTVVVGINTVVNAIFGGHPSTIQRSGTAILGGSEAGPIEKRYVASVIALACGLLLAFSATTIQSLVNVIPAGVVATFAGLAILNPLMSALRRAVGSDAPVGGFFAFAVAMSSVTFLGLGSAFWGLVAGWLMALLVDRPRGEKPTVKDREEEKGEAEKRAA